MGKGKVEEFHDCKSAVYHDQFQKWRRKNLDGFFLSSKTGKKANLHGSQCQHLTMLSAAETNESATKQKKICGRNAGDLLAWAGQNSIAVKSCKDCLRAKLIVESDLR